MSAKANADANEYDVDTLEPITHDYDRVGESVIAVCVECAEENGRRLLSRDYDAEECFKQTLVDGDDDYIPSSLWRHCEKCGRKQTHLVC